MGKKNKGNSQAQDLIPNEKPLDSEKDLQVSIEELEKESEVEEGTKEPEAPTPTPPAPKEKTQDGLNGSPRFNKINNLNK